MKIDVNFIERSSTLPLDFRDGSEGFGVSFGETQTITEKNYNNLVNKPQINSVTIEGNVSLPELGLRGVYYDTTANWNLQRNFIAQEGAIYIYKDHQIIYDESDNPIEIAGIKIGDGTSYLIDMPFISDYSMKILLTHMTNATMHLTEGERRFWNNKVSSYIDTENPERLVLSKTLFESNGEIIAG